MAERVSAVALFVAVILASFTIAPLLSVTVPEISPVIFWARAGRDNRTKQKTTTDATLRVHEYRMRPPGVHTSATWVTPDCVNHRVYAALLPLRQVKSAFDCKSC